MTRVLVVDDSRIARSILESSVAASKDYTLVRSLESAENAVVFCMSGRVDLVLMDVYTLGGESGLEAAAKIKKQYPRIKIIIVTSMPEESFIRRAKEAGCESFWYKDVGEAEILDVMNRTMAGESVYPEKTPSVKIGFADSLEFTPKELEVLRLLSSYKNYRDLADRLGITERTVRYHINNMLEKTGYETPMQLAFDVAQKGFVVTFKDEG